MELCSFTSSPIRIDISREQNLTLSVSNAIDSIGINGSSGYDKLYELEVSPESKITKTKANAFSNCTSLSSANLQTVNSLGAGSFSNCSNLKNLTLGNVTEIPDNCFINCISYSNGNWANITSLGDYAFLNTAIRTLQIPSTTEIGEYCFANSENLQTVYCTQQDSVSLENSNAFEDIKSDYTVWVKNEAYRNFYIQDSQWQTISSHISSVTQPTAKFVDGSTVYKQEKLNYDMDATPPEEHPTKTGYEFVRWGDCSHITCDIDISSILDPHQWHLYLSASPTVGGTVSGEGLYDFDSTHEISAFPNLGYKLTKWSDDNTNAIRSYKLTNDCDVTLSAFFDYITYTVKFNGNGATSGSKPTKTCTYNTRYQNALVNNPQSDGYVKNGYYVDHWNSTLGIHQTTDDIYNWSAVDESEITLSASWNNATYKGTLDHSGGSSKHSAIWWKYDITTPNAYYYDSSLTQPVGSDKLDAVPSKGGYTFTGYSNGSTQYVNSTGYIYNDLYKRYEDTTLTATWSPNEYQPIIDGGDGGTAGQCEKYTVSASSQEKKVTKFPTRSGYHITDWTASGFKPDGSTAPTIDTSLSILTIPANCYEAFTMTPSWTIDGYMLYAYTANSVMGTATVNGYTSVNVTTGSSATWKAEPKSAGYSFTKWTGTVTTTANPYTVSNVQQQYSLSANFKANSYTLSLVASPSVGGTVTGGGTYDYATSHTITATPKTGYTFSRWSNNVTTASQSFQIPASNTTLSAYFTGVTHYLSYRGNGSTSGSPYALHRAVYPGTLTVKDQNTLQRKYTVRFDGNGGVPSSTSLTSTYSFDSWNTASAGAGTSYSVGDSYPYTAAGTTTLYAQWVPQPITLPSADRTGHTLSTWVAKSSVSADVNGTSWRATTKSGITDPNFYVYESLSNWNVANSYAKMYINVTGLTQFSIYINSYAESSYDYTLAFSADVDVTSKPSSTTTGVAAHTSGAQYDPSTSDISASSAWKRVDYQLDGGRHFIMVCYQKDHSANIKDDRGYVAIQKSYFNNIIIGKAGDKYIPICDISAQAIWKPNELTIIYDGGYCTSGIPPSNKIYTYDSPVTIDGKNTLVRQYTLTCDYNYSGKSSDILTSTYDFNNWNTDIDGLGNWLTAGQTYTNPVGAVIGQYILFAQWTNGGVKLPTLSRVGYQSYGWFTTTIGGTPLSSPHYPTSNATIYALWEPNGYYVSYNKTSGSGTQMANSYHKYDQAKTLNDNTYTKTGYEFSCWKYGLSTFADRESVINLTTANNVTVDISAQWTPNTYYIRFYPEGGSGSMADMTCTYDVKYTLTKNSFAKIGCRFVNWTDDDSNTYLDQQEVSNLTSDNYFRLQANWVDNLLKVTKDSGISAICYKVNGAQTYSETTSILSVGVTPNTNWYVYAKPSTGYYTSNGESNPLTGVMGTGDETYALTSERTYSVTYHSNQTYQTLTGDSVANGHVEGYGAYPQGTIHELTAVPNEGYEFGGAWIETIGGTSTFRWDLSTAILSVEINDSAIYLKPGFSVKRYSITYVLEDGASNSSANPATYTIETDTFVLKDATKQNAVFLKWVDAETLEDVSQIDKGNVGNKTLIGVFQPTGLTLVFSKTVGESGSVTLTAGTYWIEMCGGAGGYAYRVYNTIFGTGGNGGKLIGQFCITDSMTFTYEVGSNGSSGNYNITLGYYYGDDGKPTTFKNDNFGELKCTAGTGGKYWPSSELWTNGTSGTVSYPESTEFTMLKSTNGTLPMLKIYSV